MYGRIPIIAHSAGSNRVANLLCVACAEQGGLEASNTERTVDLRR
jgi:hypothetical protein